MNRRQALYGIGATLFLSGCSKGYYRQILEELHRENKTREVNALKKIIDSYVILTSEADIEIYKRKVHKKKEGIGIVFENYILSVSHLITINSELTMPLDNVGEMPFKKTNERTTVKGKLLERIVNDEQNDLAVLRLPDNYQGVRFPFELGDSDKLQYGQEVIVVGNPELEGIAVREGTISNPSLKEGKILYTPILISGDSGTALIDKLTYKLLGLNVQRFYRLLSGAVPINLYKPYLEVKK